MKNIIIKLILLFITISSAFACAADTSSAQQSSDCLQDAESSFREANNLIQTDSSKAMELYNKSILNFQKLIDDFGIKNKHLYYNIANAWLMQGNVGKAILNYRRAENLDSSSPDIVGNLNYARSLRTDRIPVPVEKKVLETLFFWHYDFSLKTRLAAAITFWWITCLLIATMIIIKKRPAPLLAVITISLLCTAAFSGSVAFDSFNNTNYGVVTADQTIARQGDGENYPVSYAEPLHSGTEFRLLEKRQDWMKIELGNGDTTWVSDNDVELI